MPLVHGSKNIDCFAKEKQIVKRIPVLVSDILNLCGLSDWQRSEHASMPFSLPEAVCELLSRLFDASAAKSLKRPAADPLP